MEVFDKIISLLEQNDVVFEVIEHEPVHTSQDAARIRDTDISNGAKALVFRADKKPILIVIPANEKVSLRKFKKYFGVKDLSMVSKDEVFELTGLVVGSIPPVGKALGITSYYDSSFKQKNKIAYNAGSLTTSIIMKATDLIKIEEPIFGEIV